MANTAWSLLMKLQGDSSGLQSAVASSERSLTNLGKTTKSVGRGMSSAGRGMSMAITAPILGIGGAAIKMAGDWESAFAGVKKTLGEDWTGGEIDKLETDIREMSLRIPIAATELAALGEAGGALGIAKGNMLEFIEVSALLGTTTDLSAEGAATALGHLNTTMNLSKGEFTALGDAVVYLGNNGASTESQIIGMTESLAGTTKLLAFTKDETLGWAAALANTGEDVEAGATSLSRFFMETFKMAQAGGEELQLMADISGQTAADFKRNMETDISGTLESLIVGMQDLTAAEQLAVMEALGFTDIRITRALSKLIASGDNLTNSLEDSRIGFYESGAMSEEAAKRFATFESQMLLLKAAATDIAVELGTVLLPIILEDVVPAIKSGIEVVKEWVDWFKSLPEESRKSIVMWVGIAAAMGPVLFISGKIVESFGSIIGMAGKVAGLAGGIGRVATGGQGALSKIAAQPVFVTNWPPGMMAGGGAGAGGGRGALGMAAKFVLGPLAAVAIGKEIGQALNEPVIGPAKEAQAEAFDAALKSNDVGRIASAVDAIDDALNSSDIGTQIALTASRIPYIGDALGNVHGTLTEQKELLRAELYRIWETEERGVAAARDAIPWHERNLAELHNINASEANRHAVAEATRKHTAAMQLEKQSAALAAVRDVGARTSDVATRVTWVSDGMGGVRRSIDSMHGTLIAKNFSPQLRVNVSSSGAYTNTAGFAEGAWNTGPRGGLATLHAEELVLPKGDAKAFRSGDFWDKIASGGKGPTYAEGSIVVNNPQPELPSASMLRIRRRESALGMTR